MNRVRITTTIVFIKLCFIKSGNVFIKSVAQVGRLLRRNEQCRMLRREDRNSGTTRKAIPSKMRVSRVRLATEVIRLAASSPTNCMAHETLAK